MHILALLAGNVASTYWLNSKTVDPDGSGPGEDPAVPKVFGVDARNLGMAAGIAAALGFIGGPIAAVAIGAALASYNSKDATSRWTTAWDQFIVSQGALSESERLPAAEKKRGALKALESMAFSFLSPEGEGSELSGMDDYAPGALPGIV